MVKIEFHKLARSKFFSNLNCSFFKCGPTWTFLCWNPLLSLFLISVASCHNRVNLFTAVHFITNYIKHLFHFYKLVNDKSKPMYLVPFYSQHACWMFYESRWRRWHRYRFTIYSELGTCGDRWTNFFWRY